ncbi:MAG: tungsten-containing oxidoreductase [Gemmatales bacterium]|nr:MAG: tungsten-containing oxidoreductase [Gemmatales bacterium]
MHGYHGQFLHVDLTHGKAAMHPLPETVLRRFIGGVGLGTYLLHRTSFPGVNALSRKSPLIFSLSPLVGTPLTTSAKFAIVGKSPLTNRINDALSSSHFALSAKKGGFDALVIRGGCRSPSVLVIRDGVIDLQPATDLWGLPAKEARERLEERLGPGFHMAMIGPAGEKQVRYATISHENRHAGRGGLGAVMGAKKLKAIAVAGTRRTTVARPDEVVAAAKELSVRSFGPATAKYRELGTVANLLVFNRLNALPTRNFQQGDFAGAEKLAGEKLQHAHDNVRHSCAACTIGCEHRYRTESHDIRLEYESLFSLGSLCGIDDPDAVLRAARLCDQFGLDTISTGVTIAFAMECAERGLLDEPDLRFGKPDVVFSLIERIARRETGLGDVLADGVKITATEIGNDAIDFAPQVKGLEMPGYEPRTMQAMALGLAVGARGADHNRSGAYEIDFSEIGDRLHGSPEMAKLVAETEERSALLDSLILCKFLRGVFSDLFAESAELLAHVTGWDVTANELRQTAQRIITAKKLYNIREGWTPSEDTLPRRFLADAISCGDGRKASLPPDRLRAMIDAYYQVRRWNAQGYVPMELIDEYQLGDLSKPITT